MYLLEKNADTEWICTDSCSGLQARWTDQQFNETKKLSFICDFSDIPHKQIEQLLQAMIDWLSIFHYNKVCKAVQLRYAIGHSIQALRIKKGLSVEELAEAIEFRPLTINNIEEGKFSLTYDKLNKIANALGCEVALRERY